MKKRIFVSCTFFIIFCLLFSNPINAQCIGLQWNTFLGCVDQDDGRGIAIDNSGNIYITGRSEGSWGSPINAYSGGWDIFVAKLDSDGNLLWNTFFGHADWESNDWGNGIDLDSSGNIYITGRSGNWGGPTINPFSGSSDAFVAKLDNNGNLLWNSFLGSLYNDSGNDISIDNAENICVIGNSSDTWGTPINPYSNYGDAFIAKLNSNGTLLWNTFLGGTSGDSGASITIDNIGNTYVTGQSNSSWGNPIYPHSGDLDAYVAKLDTDGNRLWNLFVGGERDDGGRSIALDNIGNILLTGISYLTWGCPVHPHAGSTDAFVVKLNNNGSIQWNTFLGGTATDRSSGITSDDWGNIFVIGYSYSGWGNPVDPYNGGAEVFVSKLDANGNNLWNTFLGCSSNDEGEGIAINNNGEIFVTGLSASTWGSPVNPHAGDYDIMVAKLSQSIGIDLTVTSPNGSENWQPGTTETITWTSSCISGDVNIDLYKGGVFEYTIASESATTGSFSWSIPSGQTSGDDYKIRIHQGGVEDYSDNNFSIAGVSGELTVSSPNGGESWQVGTTQAINWTSSGMTGDVNLFLYKGGVFHSDIASAPVSAGSYQWIIPLGQTPGNDYQVRISQGSIEDFSDSNFSLTGISTDLTVTVPNGSETWQAGTIQSITWTASGLTGDVNIYLYKGGVFNSYIGTAPVSSGSYQWSIPVGQVFGNDYKIKITQGSIEDYSDNNFTINAASISVTSPNGSESWQVGTTQAVNWTVSGLTGNVIVDLYKGGAFNSNIGTASAASGSFQWSIPMGQVPGSDYKIKVYQGAIEDYSDNNFSIAGIVTDVTVTAPNGGEAWQAGTAETITWTSSGLTGDVSIYLYKGGTFNSSIGTAPASSGSYEWNIPLGQTQGTDYKIRVFQNSTEDYSDNNFTIFGAEISVTYPNGGELFQTGTTETITWNASYLSGYVTIDLYKGDVFDSTIGTALAASGTYHWSIPESQVLGTDYQIKVYQGIFEDSSDSYFSIIEPPIPLVDIKANGFDDPIIINQSDTLEIRISLDSNELTDNVDFWLIQQTSEGMFYFDNSTKSWQPGLNVTSQGPLFDITNKKVFQASGLSPGVYRFFFGVDMNMDGKLTKSCLYYDMVKVTVTQ